MNTNTKGSIRLGMEVQILKMTLSMRHSFGVLAALCSARDRVSRPNFWSRVRSASTFLDAESECDQNVCRMSSPWVVRVLIKRERKGTNDKGKMRYLKQQIKKQCEASKAKKQNINEQDAGIDQQKDRLKKEVFVRTSVEFILKTCANWQIDYLEYWIQCTCLCFRCSVIELSFIRSGRRRYRTVCLGFLTPAWAPKLNTIQSGTQHVNGATRSTPWYSSDFWCGQESHRRFGS